MITFVFTQKAKKRFLVMPQSSQDRILTKLKSLKGHVNIFSLLKKLHHFEPATHRLRIGDYRLILGLKQHEVEKIKFLILDVGDRKNIYK